MVAASEDLDAHAKQLVGETRRDAEARGGVFAVGNDKIYLALQHDIREPVTYDLPARRTNDITDEEYAHECSC